MGLVGRVSSEPPSLPLHDGMELGGTSSGVFSGRRVDLHRQRTLFPDLWAGFVKTSFRSNLEAALFFNVDESTIRNWLSGKTGPKGAVVAIACARLPGLAQYLSGEAA